MASSAPPPPPPGKGKGKHAATDALRGFAGFETQQEIADAREAAAKAKAGMSMKRKVEDLLPQFTDGKGGLVPMLQKASVIEYFPYAPNQLARNFFQLINGAMTASAKYGVNRTIPAILVMCDVLATYHLILKQYCVQATTKTVTVVPGDNYGPDATDKAALANTIDRMDLEMISQNAWITEINGMFEDAQKNILSPMYKFVNFRHDADQCAAGTRVDFANTPTFEGCLMFSAPYQVWAENALTPVEIELMIISWFQGLEFGAMVALVLSMCFGQPRAGEQLLQRRFFPYHQMCNRYLRVLMPSQGSYSLTCPTLINPSLLAGALLSRMPPCMPTQFPCFQCLLQVPSQAKRTFLPWGSSWPNTQKLQQLQVACRAHSQPYFGFPVWASFFGFWISL